MFLPKWFIALSILAFAALAAWTLLPQAHDPFATAMTGQITSGPGSSSGHRSAARLDSGAGVNSVADAIAYKKWNP